MGLGVPIIKHFTVYGLNEFYFKFCRRKFCHLRPAKSHVFACDTREYVFSHGHTQMNENHTRIGKLAEI